MSRSAILRVLPGMVLCFVCFEHSFAQSDREAVLLTVRQFFDAMSVADTAATRAILLMDGQNYSLRDVRGELVVRRTTNEEYLSAMSDRADSLLERMWDPVVSITGRIAVVTTPYDFYVNEVFSHCGTDVFNLIRTDEGWKIAGIMYTVVPKGCEESPLGIPRFGR